MSTFVSPSSHADAELIFRGHVTERILSVRKPRPMPIAFETPQQQSKAKSRTNHRPPAVPNAPTRPPTPKTPQAGAKSTNTKPRSTKPATASNALGKSQQSPHLSPLLRPPPTRKSPTPVPPPAPIDDLKGYYATLRIHPSTRFLDPLRAVCVPMIWSEYWSLRRSTCRGFIIRIMR